MFGKLYHGTTAENALQIAQSGLLPRSFGSRESNWNEAPSLPDAIYLTDIYGPYFSCAIQPKEQLPTIYLIEVDTDRLDADRFCPDEDFIEQATRPSGHRGSIPKPALQARTARIRNEIEIYHNLENAEKSLNGMGTVAYRSSIPVDAISRIILVPMDVQDNASMVVLNIADAQISIMNYKFAGDFHRKTMEDILAGRFKNTEFLTPAEFVATRLPPQP